MMANPQLAERIVASPRKGIYWIASYPKSGNTWLRIFLTELLAGAPSPFPRINRLGAIPSLSGRPLFDEIAGVSTSDLTQREIDRIRPAVVRSMLGEARSNLYFKVHDANRVNDRHERIFPLDVTLGTVYLVRNPLDVAVSYAHHSAVDVDRAIEWMALPHHCIGGGGRGQMLQPLGHWSSHVRSWIDEEAMPVRVIRYEDMLTETERTFTETAEFVGLTADAERIREAIDAVSFDRLRTREEEVGFWEKNPISESFFRSGRAGDWADVLTDVQRDRIIEDHGAVMRRLGYLDDQGEPVR